MVLISPLFHNFFLFRVGTETYQFKCLLFGLCRMFMKTLEPMVEMLRSIGIHLVIYIDDMLLMPPSRKLLREQVCSTLFLLENTGFIINNKKSSLEPTQKIEFLEIIINSVKMDISLPGEKIRNIRQETRKILSPQFFSSLPLSVSQQAKCNCPQLFRWLLFSVDLSRHA